MRGPERGDKLIALGRKVEQIGREGALDSPLTVCACCDFSKEVLVELGKERRVQILVAREIDIAAEEGHDMPVESDLDSSGIEEVPLGAPEQGCGKLKLMRPFFNAADTGTLKERRGADADRVPFLSDPGGDGVASIFVAVSTSSAAEKLPAIEKAVDG